MSVAEGAFECGTSYLEFLSAVGSLNRKPKRKSQANTKPKLNALQKQVKATEAQDQGEMSEYERVSTENNLSVSPFRTKTPFRSA